ncbi:MAG: XRE family transcriptional regulator [Sterolibacterium sp.]
MAKARPEKVDTPIKPASVDVVDIGKRVKELRLAKNLTMEELAGLSGVPASSISKIENGLLRPSFVHAINLASALEENLAFLVGRYRKRPKPRALVRAGGRDMINYPEMGLALQDLSGQFLPGVLEARLGILSKGAHSGIAAMTHRGEELCYVIQGAIRYRIDNETIDLLPREFLQFKSDLPHLWENAYEGETHVLWVFSDGLSF